MTTDEKRINFGLQLMAPYVGQAIGDTISGENITEAFKKAGIELGKDVSEGGKAWRQMAIQAYQNASNLASYLNIPTPDISIPKDQDVYIKLKPQITQIFTDYNSHLLQNLLSQIEEIPVQSS